MIQILKYTSTVSSDTLYLDLLWIKTFEDLVDLYHLNCFPLLQKKNIYGLGLNWILRQESMKFEKIFISISIGFLY